jgi:hypothetical protein
MLRQLRSELRLRPWSRKFLTDAERPDTGVPAEPATATAPDRFQADILVRRCGIRPVVLPAIGAVHGATAVTRHSTDICPVEPTSRKQNEIELPRQGLPGHLPMAMLFVAPLAFQIYRIP